MNIFKVSVCLVTYNEEHTIRECLESVKWADEIIVLDGYSKDNTVNIIKEYTENVHLVENQFNPEINKNKCIEKAKNDWVFVIDADERVTAELQQEIKNILQEEYQYVGYYIPMKNFWRNKWLKHGGFYPKQHLRLFNRKFVKYKAENVHDGLKINGEIGYLKEHMLHFAFLDIFECIEKMNKYSEVEAQYKYLRNEEKPWVKLFVEPIKYFLKTFIYKKGYKDGWEGFLVSILSTMTYFVHYLKYIELKKVKSGLEG
jgi:glycosyltransferase involved in cell wall biosynthesis